jgi:hypothetical protein
LERREIAQSRLLIEIAIAVWRCLIKKPSYYGNSTERLKKKKKKEELVIAIDKPATRD